MKWEDAACKTGPDPAKVWLWKLWPVIAMAVIFAPMWPLDRMFPQDWENQLWLLSYQACHLLETGLPAEVYNYKETAGLGTPLFYGTLIYPYGGVLTIFTGANLALRLMIIATFSLQYYSLLRLGKFYAWPVWLRHIVATLMLWAIYPLSNIYWRGATAEAWAWAFFISAVCSFIQVLKNPSGPETRYDRLAWGFYFICSFTTHVLTGFLGAAVLTLLAVVGYLCQKKGNREIVLRQVIYSGLAGAAVLLSWINLMAGYGRLLTVANPDNTVRCFTDMSRLYAQVMNVGFLLNPFSPSAASLNLTLRDEVSLEIFMGVRVSVALFLLVAVAIFVSAGAKMSSRWNRFDFFLMLAGAAIGGLSFLIMVWPSFGMLFAPVLGVIQFPYRLANYVNLGLLLVLIGWLARPIVWKQPLKIRLQLAALAVLFLALFTVKAKLANLIPLPEAGTRWDSISSSDPTGTLPSYYGRSDYTVTRGITEQQVPKTSPYVELVPKKGAMDEPTATVSMAQAGWVRTQVQPFPWAAVWVDGEKIKPEEVCYYHEFIDKRHLDEVVFLSAGTHQLDYRFDPPRLWLILRLSSFVWAGIWALLLILVGNKSRFLGLKRAPKLEAAKVRAV